MVAFRTFLQEGRYRHVFAVAFAVIAFLVVAFYGEAYFKCIPGLLKGAATVMAALSVVAYNLRCRVMDAALRLLPDARRYTDITRQAQSCGKRLTNIVVMSLFASLLSLGGGAIPIEKGIDHPLIYIYALIFGFIAFCLVFYFYILFCFELLEQSVLKFYKEKRKKSDEILTSKYLEDGRKRHPDNEYDP